MDSCRTFFWKIIQRFNDYLKLHERQSIVEGAWFKLWQETDTADIVYDILRTAACDKVVATRIMSAANLTTWQLKEYLDYIILKGLLTREINPKTKQCSYKTTPKGLAFVNVVESMHDILPKKDKKG